MTYASSDNSVADVTGTGLVTTKAVGIATITASAADKQAVLNLTVSLPVQLSIVVRASVPEPFLQLSAYSMKARHPDDSTSITSALGPSATLTGPMVIADTVEFIATGVGGSSWPSRMFAVRGEMPTSVPVVFIPQNVALTSGNFGMRFARWKQRRDASFSFPKTERNAASTSGLDFLLAFLVSAAIRY